MTRPLLIALIGGWIVGSLILGAVATRNFRMIDRLLSTPSPELSSAIAPVGQDQARVILRHVASELNRHYFRSWGFIQLALGVVLVVGALALKPVDRAGAIGAMTIFTLVVALVILNWLLVPLGRGLDFAPPHPSTASHGTLLQAAPGLHLPRCPEARPVPVASDSMVSQSEPHRP